MSYGSSYSFISFMLVAQATSKQVSKNISTTIMECLTKQMQLVYEQAVTHIQAMTTLNLAQLILIGNAFFVNRTTT